MWEKRWISLLVKLQVLNGSLLDGYNSHGQALVLTIEWIAIESDKVSFYDLSQRTNSGHEGSICWELKIPSLSF